MGAKDGGGRKVEEAVGNASAPGCWFVEADADELGVGKHAGGDEAAGGSAGMAEEGIPDDTKVVKGGVGEHGRSGAITDGPDAGRGSFQVLVDGDEAAGVGLDPGKIEAEGGGIGRAAHGGEEVCGG